MCQLDWMLLGMSVNLFIKHDLACLYIPLPSAVSPNCNFYLLFYTVGKMHQMKAFILCLMNLLPQTEKVWTVPLFSLILVNTKPPPQKRYLYCHMLPGDVFPFWLFVSFPCLLGHRLCKSVTFLRLSRVGGNKSGSYYQFGYSLPVWTRVNYLFPYW